MDDPACLDLMDGDDWRGVEEVVVPALSAFEGLAEKVGRERLRICPASDRPVLGGDGIAGTRRQALRAAGWNKWEATGLASWREGGLPRPRLIFPPTGLFMS